MLKRQIVEEIHKPARKTFPRRPTTILGYHDLFQSDLLDLSKLSKTNKGYKYILVVIDCFSKYIWCKPLKTKTSKEVAFAMEEILKNCGTIPKNLQTDDGKEYKNLEFKKLMNKYNINHYSTFSITKAAIAERVIRTLKTWLYKEFSMRGNYKWLDLINEITQKYNNTKHSKTKLKPSEITGKTNLSHIYNTHLINKKPNTPSLSVNDFVRISKFKTIFEKGYLPNWSNEIFKIIKVQATSPETYLIEDINKQPILGAFYKQELLKVKYPDVYLVEKIIRKKGQKVLVKFLGLNKSHNTWLPKKNIFNSKINKSK